MKLVHHLTIAPHRYFFVTEGLGCAWVEGGLHPADAMKYALSPVITITLSIDEVGVHYQKIVAPQPEFNLGTFLHESWTSVKLLFGIPDELLLDSTLLLHYELKNDLANIDPSGKLKSLVAVGEHEHREILSKAQLLLKPSFEHAKLDAEARNVVRAQTLDEVLNRASSNFNKHMEYLLARNYHLSLPPTLRSRLMDLERRTPTRPIYNPWCETTLMLGHDWVLAASDAVPRDNPYLHIADTPGPLRILVREADFTSPRALEAGKKSAPAKDRRWVGEIGGLQDIVRSLPYKLDNNYCDRISSEDYSNFINGRESLPIRDAHKLDKLITREPLLLYPKTYRAIRSMQTHLSPSNHPGNVCELYSSQSSSQPYRIFVMNAPKAYIPFIVAANSRLNTPELGNRFANFKGTIEIGVAGYSALCYWLKKPLGTQPKDSAPFFLGMIKFIMDSLIESDKDES